MNKQFASKNLAQSYVHHNPYIPIANPYNPQSYYPTRPSTQYTQFSPQKMSHSIIGPTRSQTSFDMRLAQPPTRHIEQPVNSNSSSRLDSKQNVRTNNIIGETVQVQYKVIENRMREIESRIQRIERAEKKSDLIAKNVQQMMRLQIKDIQCNQQLEERLVILENMITHIKTTKADRTEQQHTQTQKFQYFEHQISELYRQQEANREQIKDTKEKIHRLVSKIENNIVGASEKYEQFIERNIIKSIEQVNKLAHHYHEEIQNFKEEQIRIIQKIQSLKQKQESLNIANTSTQLIGKALPNLKITQLITLIDSRKQMIPKHSPKMIQFKGSLMNSIYDSIQKSTQSQSGELLLQKITYKLDRDLYLLDEYEHYIVDNSNNRIQLSPQHINLLQSNSLIQ